MKTTPEKLDARLRGMSADELREMAANIVKLLYLVHDEENPEPVLDSDKEWDGDTLELIAEEMSDARLCVPSIAACDESGAAAAALSVWVLSISHRHGSGVSVHATASGANAALYDWVCEYWPQESATRGVTMPEKPEDAVARYFELVEDELAEIEQAKVES